jgi:hypothetical protein
MSHSFSDTIFNILVKHFDELARMIFDGSPLIQYLNKKTTSANRGSKSRGAFANHYALYVLIEDYIAKGFLTVRKGQYHSYEGARYTDLFRRQRQLPFGAKLQNHALNSRLNDEFAKFFPTLQIYPIVRDQTEQRYWINEQLLFVEVTNSNKSMTVNIAEVLIEIIDAYVKTKRSAFEEFLQTCRQIAKLPEANAGDAHTFIREMIQPNVDARIFEIISFAILKAHYGESSIFWGWKRDELQQTYLALYKTGRTNANDGGIDFVMKPLGRFFQVTETIDVNKYFLDIDKIQRFPLTFVVKTTDTADVVLDQLRQQAIRKYGIDAIVARYMEAVEEIINISTLIAMFETLVNKGHLKEIMNEIVLQSQIEFNYSEESVDEEDIENIE